MDYKTYRDLVPDKINFDAIRAKLKKAKLILPGNLVETMYGDSKILSAGHGINFTMSLDKINLYHPHPVIARHLDRAIEALAKDHAYREAIDPNKNGIVEVKDYTLRILGAYVYMNNLLSAAIKTDILNELIYENIAGINRKQPERVATVKSLNNYILTLDAKKEEYLHNNNDVKITANNIVALTLRKNYGLVTIPNFKTFGLLGNYVLRSSQDTDLQEAKDLSNAYADLFTSATLGVTEKPLEKLRAARNNLKLKIGGLK